MNIMKILIPIVAFGNTGGYRVLSQLANHWLAQGHSVDFLVPETSSNPYFPTNAGIIWAHLDGRQTGTPSHTHRWNRFHGELNILTLYCGLNRIGANYDVILANHCLTAWAVRLARTGRAHLFYYVQAYEPDYFPVQTINRFLARQSYNLGLQMIVNAPLYCRYENIRATRVVPPGLDFALYYAKTAHKDLSTGQVVIGCIGRHEETKGTKYVLEAFEILWEKDPRFSLRVAFGNLPSGWTHPALEVVVPKNDAELADYYRSVDILVAPGTVQHGAPHYPVMEAMACATPVVTTGYLPADKSNAWIVANRNAEEIVRAIEEIILSDYRVKVDRARAAIQVLAWDAIAMKMAGYFAE